jgi:hypothetical protein
MENLITSGSQRSSQINKYITVVLNQKKKQEIASSDIQPCSPKSENQLLYTCKKRAL